MRRRIIFPPSVLKKKTKKKKKKEITFLSPLSPIRLPFLKLIPLENGPRRDKNLSANSIEQLVETLVEIRPESRLYDALILAIIFSLVSSWLIRIKSTRYSNAPTIHPPERLYIYFYRSTFFQLFFHSFERSALLSLVEKKIGITRICKSVSSPETDSENLPKFRKSVTYPLYVG